MWELSDQEFKTTMTNANQTPSKLFCRSLQHGSKVYIERQKTQNRKHYIEEQSQNIDTT